GRRLFGFQFLSRRRVDDGVWHLGLSVQEAALSVGAAGAGDRDRRQGGRRIPPIHADVERLARDIFQQYPGDDAGLAWRGTAGAAGNLAGIWENDGAVAVAAMMIARHKLRAAVEFPRRVRR